MIPKVASIAYGKKTINYADGCGGQSEKTESCVKGTWSWIYRGPGGGDGWMNTSSVYGLVCVSRPDDVRQPDEYCGPRPNFPGNFCLLVASALSNLPACTDTGALRFSSNYWGVWGGKVVPMSPNGC